jgi:hypothetical protein
MPKTGDRVIIEGTKLGQLRREGTLVEQIGTLLKVRWSDGSESLITPGAGAVRFEPGRGRNSKPAARKTAMKRSPKATAKAPKKTAKPRKTAKKATPRKAASGKAGKKKR